MNSLLKTYKKFLLVPDPPQGFIMLGATKAAKWIDDLDDENFLELQKQIIKSIESGSDTDLINLIFVAQSCDKKDLISTVKDLLHRGYGKDNEDVKIYSDCFFNPMKEGTGVQIESKWGMRTNKQVRGQKKKRGSKD